MHHPAPVPPPERRTRDAVLAAARACLAWTATVVLLLLRLVIALVRLATALVYVFGGDVTALVDVVEVISGLAVDLWHHLGGGAG